MPLLLMGGKLLLWGSVAVAATGAFFGIKSGLEKWSGVILIGGLAFLIYKGTKK